MHRLHAITFDLDDTLWDNDGVMELTEHGHYRWLHAALAAHYAPEQTSRLLELGHADGLADYVERRLRLAREVPERRGDFTWLRLRALEEQLQAVGFNRAEAVVWAEAAMEEFHRLRLNVTPHPEADSLLATLGQRYRLAAITNGNIQLARQPLAHHFPVAIAAGELFTPKPDPRAFLTTLERLDAAPQRAMHVGDSWAEDILPANWLGMHAAWVSSEHDRPLPAGVQRIAHVRELPELLEWLERRR
ncbi:HAD family hydrolase [Vreelandella jeotgali]|uniref:HAD family hydrolase n=1 Tax=Vreelandella jeotgali TaxID=553386 RepID=UPI000346D23B|nr:HAD family hydrolase [Halomonas jeotgali]